MIVIMEYDIDPNDSFFPRIRFNPITIIIFLDYHIRSSRKENMNKNWIRTSLNEKYLRYLHN